MIYFVRVSDSCATILGIIYFIREILKIVCFLVPIVLILMLTIDLIKGVLSGEDGKQKVLSYVIKRIMYAVIIFLLPSTIYAIFNILDLDTSDSNACWTYISETNVEEVKKISEAKEEALEEKNNKLQEEQAQKISTNLKTVESIKKIIDSKTNNDTDDDEDPGEIDGKITLDWDNLTKISNISGAKLQLALQKLGTGYKNFAPYANHLVKLERKHKVNVFFIIALEAHETGFITSKVAKDCNNLGGVIKTDDSNKCSSHPKYAKYNSVKKFMEYHANLLNKSYLTKGGSHYHGKSISSIQESYCPINDGDCPSWTPNIKSIGNKIYKKARKV